MATKKGKSVMDWENAADSSTPTVFYRTLNVEGLEIFYREAGPWDAPTVLLLHGFPIVMLMAFSSVRRLTRNSCVRSLSRVAGMLVIGPAVRQSTPCSTRLVFSESANAAALKIKH